ncbi:MAG: RHS repeat-associated core domain-containing protein, partial [Ruminococcus flavefaciens]
DIVTNSAGRLLLAQNPETFIYDADGNLTSDGLWEYTWDAENRLVKQESLSGAPTASKLKLEFQYDFQGRRIQKLVSTNDGSVYVAQYTNRFVYDGWNVLAILNPQSSILQSFTWGQDLSGTMQGAGGIGGLLAITDASQGSHFCAYDGNGNITALVKASDGTVSARYEYGPFGELLRATGPMAKANPFRFSTKYQDDESDLIYYGYRYYSPSTGRWLNPDPLCNGPIFVVKEVVFRELRYVFARNDGVGWIDPLGLWEGTFVVSHYNVPLHGEQARVRNIPDGETVPGSSVKYVPEKKTCSCPKDKIVIVQVISHNSNAVPGKDPHVDSSDSGPLPGAYSGARNGNLQIFDAPWNNWIFETTYTIEDCALCRNGQTPETILGCVKFKWTKKGHELDPQGAIGAGGPECRSGTMDSNSSWG